MLVAAIGMQAAGKGPRRSGLVLEPASRGQGCLLAQTSTAQCVANAKSLAREVQVMSCSDSVSDNCLHYGY